MKYFVLFLTAIIILVRECCRTARSTEEVISYATTAGRSTSGGDFFGVERGKGLNTNI